MIRFLTCSSDATPCPPADQLWSTTAEILDPAQFGVTAVEILKVLTWGFGVVMFGFLLGYALGVALKLIRSV